MSQVQHAEQDSMHAVYSFAADLMQQGRSCDEICSELAGKGLDPQSASAVVSELIELRTEALSKPSPASNTRSAG